MYLPSAFLVMLAAMALARLRISMLAPAISVILIAASIRTISYARLWNDRLALYTRSIESQPGAIRLYMNLAWEQYTRGNGEAALATVQRAQQLMPSYIGIWQYSAKVAAELGKL